jgi:DNA polymerase I-like protein with 3'-5' exonuclease and polymerase domains
MQKPAACENCQLYHRGEGFSLPDGKGTSGVVIVGDYLTIEDALQGKPLTKTTQAGAKLEQVFRLTGTSREQFLLWNVLGCRPPYGGISVNWQYAAGECDKQHGRKIVGGFSPAGGKTKTILGLGPEVLTQYTQYSGKADEKQDVKQLRGYALESSYGVYVAAYDAKFIARGMNHYTPTLEADLNKAMRIARGEWKPWEEKKLKKYITIPTLEEARAYVRYVRERQNLVLMVDIETEDSNTEEDEREESVSTEVVLMQFSHKKHFGIAFPWRGEYKKLALEILAMSNVKVGHNWYGFDGAVLRDKGHRVNGRIHDTMWMFKHWHPRLDRALQPAASMVDFPFVWKHYYGEKLAWYGCADVDATMYLWDALPERMKRLGIWEGYYNHVFELWPIMDRASQENGIPVDKEKKTVLEKKLEIREQKIDEELQLAIPDAIKNLSPRRKIGEHVEYGYKNTPKEVVRCATKLQAMIEKSGKPQPSDDKILAYIQKKTGMVYRQQVLLDKKTGETRLAEVWCKLLPFKASKDQLTKYIKYMAQYHAKDTPALAKLYVVPTATKKGETKETTGKDGLQELAEATGDDVMTSILEMRSIKKLRTNDLPNWEPARDGRVHPLFNFGPPQGQLASRRPNVQNAGKHTVVGQLFRGIIVAPPGYVFLEFDYRSFHVATMGYLANDKNYVLFSQLDPHSIFSSAIIPEIETVDFENMTVEQIKAICKIVKTEYPIVRQKIGKPTVLGNQLGLGPMRLWRNNKKHITGLNHAKSLQAAIARMFPKVERAKVEIKERAHQQTYLVNEFGRIQHFYEVYRNVFNRAKGCWEKQHGSEADKAIAFAVQSTAFGMITSKILELERLGMNVEYGFQNTVHDSLQFMCKEERVEAALRDVRAVMEQPCRELTNDATGSQGLRVAVEASIGKNWQKWDKDKNPEGMMELN